VAKMTEFQRPNFQYSYSLYRIYNI